MKGKTKYIGARFAAIVVAATGICFAFPALAFAEEAHESTGGISVLLPNMDEFIPMLIGFIILALILYKFGWPMFSAMLEKRENTVKESLEKSEAARIESERLLEEYKEQLAEAKAQSAQIVADAKKTGDAIINDMTERAQAESENMIAKAKSAIEVEKKAAISDLQSSVADMSIAIASRIIGDDLNDDEHRKIVERYVDEAGNFNAN